jgi:DNA-binding IclR family transcriptional regulator
VKKCVRKDKLNAIEKSLEILVTFTAYNRELSTGEISKLTGFHKATTSRILSTLVEYGLFAHNQESRKYSLGPLAYSLGVSGVSQTIQQFVDLASPYIHQLSENTNECISLEVWSGKATIACYFVESCNPLRVPMPLADILPLHAPAGAKAIISSMHPELISKLLDYDYEVFTDNTITTKTDLLEQLAIYNRQGYAIDNEELHLGISAIGVPVFNAVSKPVAAVSMVLPASRFTPELEASAVKNLKQTACKISKALKENTLNQLQFTNRAIA